MKNIFIRLFVLVVSTANGQAPDTVQKKKTAPFNKSWVYGGQFQVAWNGIYGENLPGTYFYKPGAAFAGMVEYYPLPYIGLGTGLGYAARGPGKKNADVDNSVGNADSSYREHYYFRNIDLPVYLSLRSPALLGNRLRFSSRLGAGWSRNYKSMYVFHSVEDGFHDYQNLSSEFYKRDWYTLASVGFDYNSGEQTLFQVQFYWQRGHNNIFNRVEKYGNAVGHNQNYGISFSVFY
jgi:hypothetical protein